MTDPSTSGGIASRASLARRGRRHAFRGTAHGGCGPVVALLLLLAGCQEPAKRAEWPAPLEATSAPASKPVSADPTHESSVKPGINDEYHDPDIPKWRGRLEAESREVYRERERIVAAAGLRPGEAVADIGAGTGLLTLLLARAVGAEGRVIAEDIVPEFVRHVGERAAAEGLKNVVVALGEEDSAALPASSIDVAFVCDTYHHFEYPRSMLNSIRTALKPGGRLVIVDFERIPGVSREWILGHVRAGRDEVEGELKAAGFRPAAVQPPAFLKENWIGIYECGSPGR